MIMNQPFDRNYPYIVIKKSTEYIVAVAQLKDEAIDIAALYARKYDQTYLVAEVHHVVSPVATSNPPVEVYDVFFDEAKIVT